MRVRNYNGLIPTALIPTVRSILAAQGITAENAITDSGDIDPQVFLALGYDVLEFRSRLLPPVKYNLKDTTTSPTTEAFLSMLQPTVILRNKYGETVAFAPKGVANSKSWLAWWLGLAGVGVIGYRLLRR